MVPKVPLYMRLKAKVYFSSNQCGLAKDDIAHFGHTLETTLRTGVYKNACTNQHWLNLKCSVAHITITCQKVSSHGSSLHGLSALSKRSITELPYTMVVAFELRTDVSKNEIGNNNVLFIEDYYAARERLNNLYEKLEYDIVVGDLKLEAMQHSIQMRILSDSLTSSFAEAICPPGYAVNPSTFLCVGCGVGSFFSEITDACEKCPKGTYQDQESSETCKVCPNGTASVLVGATSSSECLEIDECSSGLRCLNGGVCIDAFNDFSCICPPGSTGKNCELHDCVSHKCINGGTCQPTVNGPYQCICGRQYSGEHCQSYNVNGSWSAWSFWSACSKLCDDGTQLRHRSCDWPETANDGAPCKGPTLEQRSCKQQPCAECSTLIVPAYGMLGCSTPEDTAYVKMCELSCRSGYGLSTSIMDSYQCGPATHWLWPHQSPDNPRAVLPQCTKLSEDVAQTRVEYKQTYHLQCKDRYFIMNQMTATMKEKSRHLKCSERNLCNFSSPQSYCRKWQTEFTVGVRVTYSAKYSDIVEPELKELAEEVTSKFSNGSLFLFALGRRVNPGSIDYTVKHVCKTGHVKQYAGYYCVPCSKGTYYVSPSRGGPACFLCERSFYQSLTGSNQCIRCPFNGTTIGMGATAEHECVNAMVVPMAVSVMSSSLIALFTTAVGLSLLCMAAFTTACVVRQRRRRRRNRREMEERASRGYFSRSRANSRQFTPTPLLERSNDPLFNHGAQNSPWTPRSRRIAHYSTVPKSPMRPMLAFSKSDAEYQEAFTEV
ncbi:unnamed protein product [Owenia fusiformis]|uniref:EGF-like domain-containing protein n=1 Tax=Owenia fusiformis TaxID=6347 RepID=A0A8S4Q2G3_OWEFU|nr:unnamed protein product [Owenia fusiformis]